MELWDHHGESVLYHTYLFCHLSFRQYELSMGKFPYPKFDSEFDQLDVVVTGQPPRIPSEAGLSDDFKDLVHQWLVIFYECLISVLSNYSLHLSLSLSLSLVCAA